MLNKIFKILLGVLAIVFLSTAVIAHHDTYNQYPVYALETCAISTGHGLLQDYDCDGTPDQYQDYPSHDYVYDEHQYDDHVEPTTLTRNTRRMITMPSEEVNANVKVIEIQDVVTNSPGAVYPIKITNNAEVSKRFILSVEGVDFGTYRFDAGSLLIIEPGKSKTAYLHVMADPGVEEGAKSFVLEVSVDNDVQQVALVANILTGKETKNFSRLGEVIGLIVAIVILAILGAIIAREKNGKKPVKKVRKKLDGDIYSYY